MVPTVRLTISQIWRHILRVVRSSLTTNWQFSKRNFNVFQVLWFLDFGFKTIDQECKVFRVSSCGIEVLVTFHVCAHCALRIAQGTSEIDDFHQLLLLPELIGTREAFLMSIYDGSNLKEHLSLKRRTSLSWTFLWVYNMYWPCLCLMSSSWLCRGWRPKDAIAVMRGWGRGGRGGKGMGGQSNSFSGGKKVQACNLRGTWGWFGWESVRLRK